MFPSYKRVHSDTGKASLLRYSQLNPSSLRLLVGDVEMHVPEAQRLKRRGRGP